MSNIRKSRGGGEADIANESAPIQLAQCRFPGLASFNAKLLICFSNKIYWSNFIKQHSGTVIVWNYQNANYSLRKKIIVSFIIIFGTLSFPIRHLVYGKRPPRRATPYVVVGASLRPGVHCTTLRGCCRRCRCSCCSRRCRRRRERRVSRPRVIDSGHYDEWYDTPSVYSRVAPVATHYKHLSHGYSWAWVTIRTNSAAINLSERAYCIVVDSCSNRNECDATSYDANEQNGWSDLTSVRSVCRSLSAISGSTQLGFVYCVDGTVNKRRTFAAMRSSSYNKSSSSTAPFCWISAPSLKRRWVS